MRPNPSLERTRTGKALGPRDAHGLCCASRPKRLASAVRSAQTLGVVRQALHVRLLRQPGRLASTSSSSNARCPQHKSRGTHLGPRGTGAAHGQPTALARAARPSAGSGKGFGAHCVLAPRLACACSHGSGTLSSMNEKASPSCHVCAAHNSRASTTNATPNPSIERTGQRPAAHVKR